jgi:hypothetical protein
LSLALLAVITQPRSLGQCTFRSRYPIRASGFQYVPKDACLKLDFSQYPDLPGYPPHVSISWALPQALASWGILLRHGLRPGRLLQRPFTSFRASSERARDGFPRSVCPFSVTLDWCFTPDPIRVQSCAAWHARPGIIPFWACLCLLGNSQLGRFCLTTPHHTFTCVSHSHLLGGVVLSGSALTAFPSRF